MRPPIGGLEYLERSKSALRKAGIAGSCLDDMMNRVHFRPETVP